MIVEENQTNDAMETVAIEQIEVIDSLVKMVKELLTELKQYRDIEKEEKILEEALRKLGGGRA